MQRMQISCKRTMKNKMIKILLFGMSVTMVVPYTEPVSAEVVEDVVIPDETYDFRENLSVILALITEDEYGDYTEKLKQLIEKEMLEPDETFASVSEFLEALLYEASHQEMICDKLTDLFGSIYAEEVLDGFRNYYMGKMRKHTESGYDTAETIAFMENAMTLEEIRDAYEVFLSCMIINTDMEELFVEEIDETSDSLEELPTVLEEEFTGDVSEETEPDEVLKPLIEESVLLLESFDTSSMSETYMENARSLIQETTDALRLCTSKEEIEQKVSDAMGKLEVLKKENSINEARTIALDGLEKHYLSLSFSVEQLSSMAELKYGEFKDKILKETDETNIGEIFDQAVLELSDISNETEGVVNIFLEQVLKEAEVMNEGMSIKTEITNGIYDIVRSSVEKSASVKEILSKKKYLDELYPLLTSALTGNIEDAKKCISILDDLTEDHGAVLVLIQDSMDHDNTEEYLPAEYVERKMEEVLDTINLSDIGEYADTLHKKLLREAELLNDEQKSKAAMLIEERWNLEEFKEKSQVYVTYQEIQNEMKNLTENEVEDELQMQKEEAKKELSAYTDASYESVKKVIEAYSAKIDQASDIEKIRTYLEDGKNLIDKLVKGEQSKDLNERKEAAIIELKNYVQTETPEILTVLEVYTEKIDEALEVEEIKSLLHEAKMKMNEASEEFNRQIEAARLEVLGELNLLMKENEDSELLVSLMEIYHRAENSINGCNNIEEIYEIYDSEKASMESLIESYQREVAFTERKNAIIDQIDNMIQRITNEELKVLLKKIGESYKLEVQYAESEEELQEILASFQTKVKDTTTEFTTDKALTVKKTELAEKIESWKSDKTLSSELLSKITDGKESIYDAESIEAAETTYQKLINDMETLYLEEIRTRYVEELDMLYGDIAVEDTSIKDKIYKMYEKAKENIRSATNEQVMQNILKQVTTNTNTILDAYDAQTEAEKSLGIMKEQAIEKLQSSTSVLSSGANKVISAYTNKINQASSETQINEILAEGLSILEKLESSEGQTNINIPGNDYENDTFSTDGETFINEPDENEALEKDIEKGTDIVKTGDHSIPRIIFYTISLLTGLYGAVAMILRYLHKKNVK